MMLLVKHTYTPTQTNTVVSQGLQRTLVDLNEDTHWYNAFPNLNQQN